MAPYEGLDVCCNYAAWERNSETMDGGGDGGKRD